MSTKIISQPIIDASNQGFTVYTALLTQTSTNAPVATVLQNTTGSTLTWARTNVGEYTLTASSPGSIFVVAKTVIITQDITAIAGTALQPFFNDVTANTTSILKFVTAVDFSGGGLNSDGVLNKTFIEIRIYQ